MKVPLDVIILNYDERIALRKYVKKWPNCSQGEDSLKLAMFMPKAILYHF